MKLAIALSMAFLASAAPAQELKKAEPPTRPGTTPVVQAKTRFKIALPSPIVFSRSGAQKDLWKLDTEGVEARLSSGEDSSPARYSGGRIYFTRRTSGSAAMWSMKSDGNDGIWVD